MPKYIDADALLKEAKRLSGPQTGDGWDNWGVYALIERQPAANVEPRRESGMWIEQPDRPNVESNRIYRCSVCGYADEQSPTTEVPYCWHCGSRMRKMKRGEDNGSVQ